MVSAGLLTSRDSGERYGSRLMLTEQLFDRLSATWRDHGVPIEDALVPGGAVESFTSDDGALHVDLPDELRTWWSWHDGASWGALGPDLTAYASTKSREWWQTMRTEAANMATNMATDLPGNEMAHSDFWWQETRVPLASNGAGGYIVADCRLGSAGATPILSSTGITRSASAGCRLARAARGMVDRSDRTRHLELGKKTEACG
jgi:cell wall assembly regulator SMI1